MTDPTIVRTPSGLLAGSVIDTDHGPVYRARDNRTTKVL